MRLLIRLVIALLICAAIALIAWGVLAIVALLPIIPGFVVEIIRILVYVVAGVSMILTLAEALTGWPKSGLPWPM